MHFCEDLDAPGNFVYRKHSKIPSKGSAEIASKAPPLHSGHDAFRCVDTLSKLHRVGFPKIVRLTRITSLPPVKSSKHAAASAFHARKYPTTIPNGLRIADSWSEAKTGRAYSVK